MSGTVTTGCAASAITHDEAMQQLLPAIEVSQLLSRLCAGALEGDSLEDAAWSCPTPGIAIDADAEPPSSHAIQSGPIVCLAKSINTRTPAARRTAKRERTPMMRLAGNNYLRSADARSEDSPIEVPQL